jgi:hypothetical protein
VKIPWRWFLLAVCSLAWLTLALTGAPAMAGTDVFVFRDAGWNLAAHGAFEAAGLPSIPDLAPRFYSHYTPLLPLLFAGFLKIFRPNPYSGTLYNLLLGLAVAAMALARVGLQTPGRLRSVTLAAIAVLPVAFVSTDRPEALGLVLFALFAVAAARRSTHPLLLGVLVALLFLAHPFAAVCAALWSAALVLARNLEPRLNVLAVARALALEALAAVAALALVAALYYRIDPTSLARFAGHAFGVHSGAGVALNPHSKAHLLAALREGVFHSGPLVALTYFFSLVSAALLAGWLLLRRRTLEPAEWLPAAAGLACLLLAIFAFPAQNFYVNLLAVLIPLGLLTVTPQGSSLRPLAQVQLLLFLLAALPSIAVTAAEQQQARASFEAAAAQPEELRRALGSPEAVVAVSSGAYDVFKPAFPHLVNLEYVDGHAGLEQLSGVADCYFAFAGDAATLVSLPPGLSADAFTLIDRAPRHLWITAFGHRVMKRQWGYGCDLYVRNSVASGLPVHPIPAGLK